MALKGLKVIELAGLAPVPMCGMILRDFGARVIQVASPIPGLQNDAFSRGKESIVLNLKQSKHIEVMRKLCSSADVLLDPYRPGVLEKLTLDPASLMTDNPRLIIARLTGYGQSTSPTALKAGHDINYLASSGVLSHLGEHPSPPNPPVNLLADFAGGGLTCAMGIILALYQRSNTGLGQIVDSSMTEGAAYLSTFLWSSREALSFIWGQPRGGNILDGGAPFYRCYATKDGGMMAVGAIEPQFYSKLLEGLGLDTADDVDQFDIADGRLARKFADIFATKTRDEWTTIFDNLEACVNPVLDHDEAQKTAHATERNSFLSTGVPAPAPRLSASPFDGCVVGPSSPDQHTNTILQELGYSQQEIDGMFTPLQKL